MHPFSSPSPSYSSVILAQRFIQLHTTPLSLCEVCVSKKPHHSCLGTTNLCMKVVEAKIAFKMKSYKL